MAPLQQLLSSFPLAPLQSTLDPAPYSLPLNPPTPPTHPTSVESPHERKALSPAQQADFVRFAALRPRDRLRRLLALLQQLLSSFRLAPLVAWGVKIGESLLRVMGRLLPSSPLQFGGGRCVDTGAAGEWDRARPRGRIAFALAATLKPWGVLNLAGSGAADGVGSFLKDLQRFMNESGVAHSEPSVLSVDVSAAGGGGRGGGGGAQPGGGGVEGQVQKALKDLVALVQQKRGGDHPVLALVVLPEQGVSLQLAQPIRCGGVRASCFAKRAIEACQAECVAGRAERVP